MHRNKKLKRYTSTSSTSTTTTTTAATALAINQNAEVGNEHKHAIYCVHLTLNKCRVEVVRTKTMFFYIKYNDEIKYLYVADVYC
jgi:hypothetical protein